MKIDRCEYDFKGKGIVKQVYQRFMNLSELPAYELNDLPRRSCIYFCVNSKSRLIYIGQTPDIYAKFNEFAEHRMEDKTDRIYILPCSDYRYYRRDLESALIAQFDPKYNQFY